MIGILSLFIIFNSTYSDLTIDLKDRVIFLSSEDRIVEDTSNLVHFSLDSMFAPISISSSSFSVWVTSSSEFKSQKYSLWGELLGKLNIGGKENAKKINFVCIDDDWCVGGFGPGTEFTNKWRFQHRRLNRVGFCSGGSQ